MKRHCANCQKETDLEKEIYYTIANNFDKYGGIMWCSNCLKAVQKICEEKWGVNKDCLFGENAEQVHKHGRRIDKDDNYMVICPWCEVQFRWGNSLDHYYHFHGKDKGKCNKDDHKTEEEIKEMENWGSEYKDVRKVLYVEGSPDVNSNDNRERERERESKIAELRKRIEALEAIVNRTPQEEQELKDKKQELAELEKQQSQEPKKTNWTPWLIGGGITLILVVGIIAYFLWKKKE